ncbi:DUF1003 domain-containing protein [Streptomyces sp. NBC_01497]|uniref:DUF1003 domain-containing protein n=1 Tax=Streptomyces sp. NBC_01497 TaxID=2903885 RepID=UPI003FCE81BC
MRRESGRGGRRGRGHGHGGERREGDGRRRVRLDQPREQRRRLLPEWDPEAFGRLSERVARFLGTGRFIVWMTLIIILWVVWNIAAPRSVRFDEYPFIFLTLALSLQASYAAPLILLAQNRQDDRDRVTQEQERKQNERSIADTEYLTREIAALRIGLGEVATRDWIRSELEDLVRELDERRDGHHPPGGDTPRAGEARGGGASRDA